MSSSESRRGGARRSTAVREGLLAGLIGAAVMAVWFLVLDVWVGRMFFTPAALGSALFLGAGQPAAVQITAGTVLAYTFVHVAVFLALGVVFGGLVWRAEEHPSLMLALVLLFVTTLTLSIGVITILASWLLAELRWWAVAVGNLLAAGSMTFFLWQRHPGVGRALPDAEERAAAVDHSAGPGGRGPEAAEPRGDVPHYRPRGPSAPEGGERA
jgi:hypothetical protein